MSALRRIRLLLLAAALAGGPALVAQPAPEADAAEPAAGVDGAPAETAEARQEATEAQPEAPALSPRGHYNQGLSALAAGDAAAAAAAFLAARDNAGPDPVLRYRAAFNLGMALAAQADAAMPDAGAVADDPGGLPPTDGSGAAAPAELEKTIDLLRQSAAWFNDAVRLAPADDEDARVNLELISRRILALADQLNEGDKLEGRLDRLIDDQRGVRDQVRRLLGEVLAEAASAEPVGFQSAFDSLAARQRVLMAEIGDSIDLATEERLFIEQSPPETRTPEAEARAARLAAVTDYLERARQSLGDARRRLRRLQGERGHRAADRGLAELKRAREQLRDPVTVLQAVARDESQLIAHTGALAAATGNLDLERPAPAWLTPKHLAERQEDAAVRAGGVLTIFEAMLASGSADAQADADAERARAAVAEAAPILERGLAAMRDAMRALDDSDAAGALPAQHAAGTALADAIELFADVKTLIELAYQGQRRVVALLGASPDDEDAQAALDVDERAALLGESIFAGQRRLSRLESLLADEAAAASRNAGAPADAPASGDDAAEAEQAADQARQLYELAEQLRSSAADGLARLADAVDAIATAAGGDAGKLGGAQTQAANTLETLGELRRLFFSVVEHLQALRADQAQTHDQTATAQFESTVDKLDVLPAELAAAAERQGRHAGIGEQLTAALAQQADAAAGANDATATPAPAPTGQPPAERFAEASEEMRQATVRMRGAAAGLAAAAERATSMSPELEPTMADQTAALEHIENALLALSPPDGEQDQDGNQNEQQGDGAQQEAAESAEKQDGEEQRMSERQALKRLQAIRDREAERARRRDQAAAGREPVEKDW